jgi:hypothetical protein
VVTVVVRDAVEGDARVRAGFAIEAALSYRAEDDRPCELVRFVRVR